MEPIPGKKTATEYLAYFSLCVPFLMLLWLGLLRGPMNLVECNAHAFAQAAAKSVIAAL